MKRNSHPLRRHKRRHLPAATRYALRCDGYFGAFGPDKRPQEVNPFPPFARAKVSKRRRHITLPLLIATGYPAASLANTADWTPAHAWLKTHATHKWGRRYTWFGGTFVFERPEDHAAFTQAFACADGYKPMFAFEVGR